MFITKKFVVLNFPKTGSTFIRSVLRDLHQPGPLRAALIKTGLAKAGFEDVRGPRFSLHENDPVKTTQHLVYAQIPEKHRSKAILSVVRNPLRSLISAYEFRDWARYPAASLEQIKEDYPHFPELDFREFVAYRDKFMMPRFLGNIDLKIDIGSATAQFIRFHAKSPRAYLEQLGEDSDLREDWSEHFPQIHFIHTETLGSDLHQFLLQQGYPERSLDFIKKRAPINTTKKRKEPYFDSETLKGVLHKERLLFKLFPHYQPDLSEQELF